MNEKYFHKAFEVGALLKGLNGILETTIGILLSFVKPSQITSLAQFFTRRELAQDPHDLIANYLMQAAHQLSVSAKLFFAAYIFSHGIVKILIVIGLLKKKLWVYPVGIAVFGAFALYQIYRYTYSHSPALLVLTTLDAAVIFLTYHEYVYMKNSA